MLSPYLKNLLKPQYSESQIILQFIVQLYHKDFQIIKVTVILSFIGNITKNKTKTFLWNMLFLKSLIAAYSKKKYKTMDFLLIIGMLQDYLSIPSECRWKTCKEFASRRSKSKTYANQLIKLIVLR